jgi:hypothetical protein
MRVGVVIGAVAVLCASQCAWGADDDISFAPKNFAELGDSFVGISGTLTGDGLAYKNNTYSISCYRDRKECFVTSIEQIGSGQIGRMDYMSIYPITRWNQFEVVAAEDPDTFGCMAVTITITRKTENALWVQQPINQTRPECLKSDTKTHKYTVEDSIGWKRMNRK